MHCCCNRKSKNDCEMIERSKKESKTEKNNNLSCIYELVMTPRDNSSDTIPDIQPIYITPTLSQRRKSVYVNFFEVDEPNTPCTPELLTPTDVNDNTIHLKIPRGSNLYVNYERHYFDDF